jgi:Flp pilus assembly protein TadD
LEAEKDCSRGIQLQPKNVKALWRRGIALRELGRINEARKGNILDVGILFIVNQEKI